MSRSELSSRQWLLAYDVSSASRRRRLAGLLEGYAVRIQRSVFRTECTQHAVIALLKRAELIVAGDDRVRAWPVVAAGGAAPLMSGQRRRKSLPDYWIV
jgi:CRISPR-associated endonuclease Cas2